MKNLPTDLLRAFVAVAEHGGFTAAGARLGRSQPAVSLQIKRLEDLLGKALVQRASGRRMRLTEDGDLLLAYARQMLALNDEVTARLTQPQITGCVRLGIPNEFASSFLPKSLGQFAQAYPDVGLNVGCDLSTNLLRRLDNGEFDLVLGLHDERPLDDEVQGWMEPLAWVTSPDGGRQHHSPLPLIVAPQGCVYRNRLLHTLDGLRRDWRIVYTSPSFGGIRAGVMAGLGVTVMSERTVPAELQLLHDDTLWPPLGMVYARLHYDRVEASDAVRRLVEFMMASARDPLRSWGGRHRRRSARLSAVGQS